MLEEANQHIGNCTASIIKGEPMHSLHYLGRHKQYPEQVQDQASSIPSHLGNSFVACSMPKVLHALADNNLPFENRVAHTHRDPSVTTCV